MNGEGNVEALVNEDVADVDEAAGEEVDIDVGVAGGSDAEGGAAETIEGEPALGDEGAGVVAGLGVEAPEDLDDELFGETRVDPVISSSATHPSHLV